MKAQDKELLDHIADYFERLNVDFEKETIGGLDSLVIHYTIEEEILPEDCTITIHHPDANCTAIQLLFSMFSILDSEKTAEVSEFFDQMNSLLSLGYFGAVKDSGFVYFSYAFLTDKLTDENILSMLNALFGILTLTAAKGRELLLPLVLGKITKEELLNEDLSIVQD